PGIGRLPQLDEGPQQRLDVVAVAAAGDPAEGLELVGDRLHREHLGGPAVGLLVVEVDDRDEVVQRVVRGDRGGLPGGALAELAVGEQVVHEAVGALALQAHRDSVRDPEAVPEGAAGDLDAGGVGAHRGHREAGVVARVGLQLLGGEELRLGQRGVQRQGVVADRELEAVALLALGLEGVQPQLVRVEHGEHVGDVEGLADVALALHLGLDQGVLADAMGRFPDAPDPLGIQRRLGGGRSHCSPRVGRAGSTGAGAGRRGGDGADGGDERGGVCGGGGVRGRRRQRRKGDATGARLGRAGAPGAGAGRRWGYGADCGDDVVGVCVGVGVREMRRHRSKCSAMAAATASRRRERSAFVISKWTESLANISGTSPPLAAISLLITTRRRSSSRSCRARFMPPATWLMIGLPRISNRAMWKAWSASRPPAKSRFAEASTMAYTRSSSSWICWSVTRSTILGAIATSSISRASAIWETVTMPARSISSKTLPLPPSKEEVTSTLPLPCTFLSMPSICRPESRSRTL